MNKKVKALIQKEATALTILGLLLIIGSAAAYLAAVYWQPQHTTDKHTQNSLQTRNGKKLRLTTTTLSPTPQQRQFKLHTSDDNSKISANHMIDDTQWTRYVDEKFNFTIAHPRALVATNIQTQSAEKMVQFQTSHPSFLSLASIQIYNRSLEDQIDWHEKQNGTREIKAEQVLINNILAYQHQDITHGKDATILHLALDQNTTLQVSYAYDASDLDPAYFNNIRDKMFSSIHRIGKDHIPEKAEWSTYTDPNHNYSFTYPATWHLETFQGGVSLQSFDNSLLPARGGIPLLDTDMSIEIAIQPNKQNLSIEEWVNESRRAARQTSEPINIIIDGISGLEVKRKYELHESTTIYAPYNQHVYSISMNPNSSELIPTARNIVESFTF